MAKTLPNECIRTICEGVSRKQLFVVYPSIEIAILEDQYYAAVDALGEADNVFFSGNSIIVPEAESDTIQMLLDTFQGQILKKDIGNKFATLAISEGVDYDLVSLGAAIQDVSQLSAQDMVKAALSNADTTRKSWKELYLSSMNEH